MKPPELSTGRLLLRGAESGDVDALQAIWNHDDVRRFLFDDQPVSVARTQEVLDIYHSAGERGHGLWVVALRDDPAVIGCVGLLETDLVAQFDANLEGMIEVVAAFDPAHWHHGYAHEALREVLAYAFDTLDLESVAGVADLPNTASHAMLSRTGFVVVGECDGPHYRMRTYRLDRERFRRAATDD